MLWMPSVRQLFHHNFKHMGQEQTTQRAVFMFIGTVACLGAVLHRKKNNFLILLGMDLQSELFFLFTNCAVFTYFRV